MMERCDSVKRSNETINGYIESSINLDSSALITKVIFKSFVYCLFHVKFAEMVFYF